ncbi:MAG: ABC transporter substrate-binding protein [Nitrospiraceae bacterium]|nr:MAG: ABC transporter substrate-binding protein [Nitrospiraceae bacterium]
MKNKKADGWSRREFLGGLALTGAAAVVGWRPDLVTAAVEPPPETTRLRFHKGKPACWAPIYVAEPLLREEGFTDVQYVFGPQTEVGKMFSEGKFDLNVGFSAKTMYNLEHQPYPLKFLSGLHVGCYALIGSARTRSVRDLKGRTVWAGAIENDGPHLFFSTIVAYVGLDPRTDVNYVWVDKDEAIRLFRDGKIDAFMSFPPGAHELRHNGLGHLLIDTNVDKPWSQYFCCMVAGHSDFIRKNPIATRRALRAILKANDIVARDPETAARILIERKVIKESEYVHILPELKHIPYNMWRDYNPEDTIRFYALRMREIGTIKSNPQQFIDQHADWRFMNELKKEFGITW